jgi:GNAT superfamily N-acetyltransferase
MTNRQWRLRAARADDLARWRELFKGYADFYQTEQTDAAAMLVWEWIHDEASPVACLLAVDDDDRAVGLAHYRPFPRPARGAIGCYLDDLFVDPAVRGGGAADALLLELRRLAAVNGWNVVRWITADDNHRARAKYDRYATRTMWVTYDMAPEPG